MEWVETRGRTLDDAKEQALDQLGVAEDDAEFEILEEPRPGLFGRVRGEARVRARVRPTQPRPKLDRRDRRKRGARDDDGTPDDAAVVAPSVAGGLDAELAAPVEGGTERPDDVVGDDGVARPARPRARRGGRSGRGAGAGARPDASEQAEDELGTAEGPADATTADAPVAARDVSGAGAADPPRSRRSRTPRAAAAATNGDEAAAPGRRGRDDEEANDVDAQQVGDEAQRFVQGLVDAFGLQGTTSLRRDGDDLEVAVEGADLGLLVGPRGSTLQAVQELTRVAAQHRLGDHDTRLRVDVAGYRERRREALTRFAQQIAAEVVAEGAARRLEPMSSADRKVIHDVLGTVDGVVTRSEGEDPQRRVVIEPAAG